MTTGLWQWLGGWFGRRGSESAGIERAVTHPVNGSTSAPRVLLLTSELGCGHARAAEAIRLALLERAPHAAIRVFDWWSLINPGVATAAKDLYLRLVTQESELYEQIYGLSDRTWRELLSARQTPPEPVLRLCELLRDSQLANVLPAAPEPYPSDRVLFALFCASGGDAQPWIAAGMHAKLALIKWSWARLVRRLRAQIEAFAPDVIVSTQMIPAALVSSAKSSPWTPNMRGRLDIPSIAVPTDFGVHDFWIQPGTDLYCLGHELLSEVPPTLNRRRVVVTGFPLMPQFANHSDAASARRQFGFKLDTPLLLVLGGGLGLGVEGVAQSALRLNADVQVAVLVGRNRDAWRRMQALAAQDRRVRVFEWTDRVDLFMRAADLVIGKAGGMTVAEVLACGRPFIATRSLRGQESFNVRFIERQQVGRSVTDAELTVLLNEWLTAPTRLAALRDRARLLGNARGAQSIAEQALRLASDFGARERDGQSWQVAH